MELHGSHRHLRCHLCQDLFDWEHFEPHIAAGQALLCPNCKTFSDKREGAGKRRTPISELLPDIVHLGQQNHPYGDAISRITMQDERASPDFLLVLETGLKVDGPKKLVKRFAKVVRASHGVTAHIGLTKPLLQKRNARERHGYSNIGKVMSPVKSQFTMVAELPSPPDSTKSDNCQCDHQKKKFPDFNETVGVAR